MAGRRMETRKLGEASARERMGSGASPSGPALILQTCSKLFRSVLGWVLQEADTKQEQKFKKFLRENAHEGERGGIPGSGSQGELSGCHSETGQVRSLAERIRHCNSVLMKFKAIHSSLSRHLSCPKSPGTRPLLVPLPLTAISWKRPVEARPP